MLLALKASGVIALLMNLKIIVDILSGIFAVLNLGILLFLKKVYEFFQDPMRGLLNVVLFLANVWRSIGESIINAIKPGEDVDLGRFRADIIGEELDAGTGLLEAISKGLLTEKQYRFVQFQKSKELEDAAKEAFAEEFKSNMLRKELATVMAEDTNVTLGPALNDASSTMLNFLINFQKKANEMNKELTGKATTTRVTQRQISTDPLAGASTAELLLKRTNIVDARAQSAFNYLRGLGS